MRSTIFLLPLTIACAPTLVDAPASLGHDDAARLLDGSEEAALAIHAANQLSLEALDAVLDVRAAEGIVAGRPFLDLDSLDAVPYVGDAALDDLVLLARDAFGAVPYGRRSIPPETLILWAANEVSHGTLDGAVGLDRRAADGIVAARPFANVDTLDAVPYVGPAALDALEAYGIKAFGTDCDVGTLVRKDGAVFTDLATALADTNEPQVVACAGTLYGDAAWFEGADHDVAVYGFGADETVFDGLHRSAFVVGLADTSTYTFYGTTLTKSDDGWFSAVGSSRDDTTIELLAVDMSDNRANKGGAVYTLDEVVAIDSTFSDNVASWYGGAVAGRSGTFVDCVFADNQATDQAAAVRMWHDLTVLGGAVVGHEGPAALSAFTSNADGTHQWVEGVDFGSGDDANTYDLELYGERYDLWDLDADSVIVCHGTDCES